MAYLLVNAEVLKNKGIEHFSTVPDGRGIIHDSDAKTMGNLGMVQVFWTSAALKDYIKAEEAKEKAKKEKESEAEEKADKGQSEAAGQTAKEAQENQEIKKEETVTEKQ